MKRGKLPYRPGSQAARFLTIRDAILSHVVQMRDCGNGFKELAVGRFLVIYGLPGANGIGRGHNLQIWPGGAEHRGLILHGNKVANVDWNQWDEVDIIAFRGGGWELELLELLGASGKVVLFPRRRHVVEIEYRSWP